MESGLNDVQGIQVYEIWIQCCVRAWTNGDWIRVYWFVVKALQYADSIWGRERRNLRQVHWDAAHNT
jgi:hypothetical protein